MGKSLPQGTIISVGEGETLLSKILSNQDFQDERCYVVGESQPRERLIHEQPTPLLKTACNYDYITHIWPENLATISKTKTSILVYKLSGVVLTIAAIAFIL